MIDNNSDHCPIYCVVYCQLITVQKTKENSCPKQPSWKKADIEEKNNFVNILDQKLKELEIPPCARDCNDVHCKDAEHIDNVANYASNVFELLESTAKDTLPITGGKRNEEENTKPKVPGWSLHVKPFKDSAMFWHSIWVSFGKPVNNQLHNVMKHSRNKYHYKVRKQKQKLLRINC